MARLWLGHRPSGERLELRAEELREGLLILGAGAELEAGLVLAAQEAGLRLLALDLEGSLYARSEGAIERLEAQQVLYDVQKVEPEDREHGRLLSAAYASCLLLTTAQEALLDSLVELALPQAPVLSPAALADMLSDQEGFAAQELRARLSCLGALNVLSIMPLRELLNRSCVLDLSSLRPLEARCVAAWLIIAKLLSLGQEGKSPLPDLLLLNGSHAVFPAATARPHRGDRLIVAAQALGIGKAFSTRLWFLVDQCLAQLCRFRLYSAHAWNRLNPDKGPILPTEALLLDALYARKEVFVPREPRPAPPAARPSATGKEGSEELLLLLLRELAAKGSVTRAGLISYFSAKYGREECEAAVEELCRRGLASLQVKEVAKGVRVLMLVPTQRGLLRLKENGAR
jgi:hypothetical protein